MILATTTPATPKAPTGYSKAAQRFSLSWSFWCLPPGSPTKVITDYLFTIEQNKAFGLPLGEKSVVFFSFALIHCNQMRKTHKGIAKRFKVTGTGKVTHRKPGQRHLRRKRTVKQMRAGRQDQSLAKGMARRVIEALG